MFIVFGVKTVQRDVRNSVPERAHCDRCGFISDFRYQRQRLYATIFFLPVFPVSKADLLVTCNRCGASYYAANNPRFSAADARETDSGKTIFVCPACAGRMRIPLMLDRSIRVTCPHCSDQFTVSVNRP